MDSGAYTAQAIPFRWVNRDNVDDWAQPKIEVRFRGTTRCRGVRNWVFSPVLQEAILQGFWAPVGKEDSLVIFYTKGAHPVADDVPRLIVGIADIAELACNGTTTLPTQPSGLTPSGSATSPIHSAPEVAAGCSSHSTTTSPKPATRLQMPSEQSWPVNWSSPRTPTGCQSFAIEPSGSATMPPSPCSRRLLSPSIVSVKTESLLEHGGHRDVAQRAARARLEAPRSAPGAWPRPRGDGPADGHLFGTPARRSRHALC